MARNTLSRALHDLGLSAWFGGTLANARAPTPPPRAARARSRALPALGLPAWFGGTLANAVALNAAAGAAGKDTGRVANAGWNRWTPGNAVATRTHLAGAARALAG